MLKRLMALIEAAFGLAIILGAGSCSSDQVATRGDDPARYGAHDSYTWSSSKIRTTALSGQTAVTDQDVMERVHDILDGEFRRCGLAAVGSRDAGLSVAFELSRRNRISALDPYYSSWIAEKWEEGLLTVVFTEVESGRLVWQGRSSARLRTLARGTGVTSTSWTEVAEDRHWPIEDMVAGIVTQSGLAESGLDEESANKPLSRNSRRALFRRLEEAFPEPSVELAPLGDDGSQER